MERSEIKRLLLSSLESDADTSDFPARLGNEGVEFDFADDFSDRVLDRVSSQGLVVNREQDFLRSMNSAFYRIALTGVAAILLLLVSIFIMQGSLSFNSLLGLVDNYDESIVCLLTGN